MKLSEKVNAALIGLVILLAFGCNKEKDNGSQEPDWSQYKCRVAGDGTGNYIYNASGQLVRIIYPPSFMGPGDSSYAEVIYNAAGNIATYKNVDRKGELWMHLTYTYNAAHLPDTLFYLEKGVKKGFKKFDYYPDGKLSKVSYFDTGDPEVLGYSDFTYPAPDQSMEKNYYRLSTGWFTGPVTVNHYDNKNHPFSQLGFYGVDWYTEEILVSKHNIVTSNRDGVKKEWHYIYNEQGYPTDKSLVGTSSSFPSPYGSLGLGGEGKVWYYNCQ